MKAIMKFIADEMKSIGIDYHLGSNKKSPPTYPYFVGEFVPVNTDSEDGRKEMTLLLDGFTRKTATSSGDLLELLLDAEKIEDHFPCVSGLKKVVKNQAIVAYFVGVRPIDTDDEQLNRLQVTVEIKTWKGSN